MDCTSDNGELAICYAASLRWRALSLHYASVLYYNGSAVHTRASLRKSTNPHGSNELIAWNNNALGITGEWRALAPAVQHTLLHTPEGSIEWRCLQPRSQARVQFSKQADVYGIGYVEHLQLSIPPWHLPIRELRWGRYASADHGIVWIDWRGVHPLRLVLHNEKEVNSLTIDDHRVQFDNTVLHLSESTVLRKGPLVNTALAVIPGIRNLFPERSLHTDECKWRSRGTLFTDSATVDSGWAIHEVVRFT